MIAVAIITAIINELPVDRLRALPVAAVISAPEQEQASAPAPAPQPDEAPQRKRRRGRKVARAKPALAARAKRLGQQRRKTALEADRDDNQRYDQRPRSG
jgi:hypothetical protein